MDNNYLITGYWGEPHVTAENDRGINAAIFGAGRFVLPVGRQFAAEYIGNNTIRIYDGKLMDNGAAAGIPAGEYIDILIANAGQGLKRNDLIVFQYEQDASTLVERGTFVVVQGAETSGTPSDPKLTQADLLSGSAVFDQMALWRISVSGGTIAAPEKLFTVPESLSSMINAVYPVGSVYMSTKSASPASLFGGTWEQIEPTEFTGQPSVITVNGSIYGEANSYANICEVEVPEGCVAYISGVMHATTSSGDLLYGAIERASDNHHYGIARGTCESGGGIFVNCVTNASGKYRLLTYIYNNAKTIQGTLQALIFPKSLYYCWKRKA